MLLANRSKGQAGGAHGCNLLLTRSYEDKWTAIVEHLILSSRSKVTGALFLLDTIFSKYT